MYCRLEQGPPKSYCSFLHVVWVQNGFLSLTLIDQSLCAHSGCPVVSLSALLIAGCWLLNQEGHSAPWPFTMTCTATNCFKVLAHCCIQWPQHLRNPIHLLHALVLSAGMSHQWLQVSNWHWSLRIMPTNNSWPPTTPWHWRPPTPPLPSPTSTFLPSVASSGNTASQPYPGSVWDGCSFVVHNLEPDDESDS